MPHFLRRFLHHRATPGALLTLIAVALGALLGDDV